MTFQLTVSPDFTPERISGWFIFNTWLQRQLEQGMHLELYDSFTAQRAAIAEDKVDLIYANPFDAAMLVREKGFSAVARPRGKSDEALVVVKTEHSAQGVEDLAPGLRISSTDDPDVHMMCMIMLEPADLNQDNIQLKQCDSYVLVAKDLLRGEADAGFFLQEAFAGLSPSIRKELRPLVTSQIQVIQHVLLAGPGLSAHRDTLLQALIAMEGDPKGQAVLESLGLPGWEAVDQEQVEFMIDLMDTLIA